MPPLRGLLIAVHFFYNPITPSGLRLPLADLRNRIIYWREAIATEPAKSFLGLRPVIVRTRHGAVTPCFLKAQNSLLNDGLFR
jgi:hypothetical protein